MIDDKQRSLITYNHVTYLLYVLSYFTAGLLWMLVIAFGGIGFSVLSDSGNLALVSIVLTGLGLMIIAFTFIWHLYRIVRGWIALTDSRSVP